MSKFHKTSYSTFIITQNKFSSKNSTRQIKITIILHVKIRKQVFEIILLTKINDEHIFHKIEY